MDPAPADWRARAHASIGRRAGEWTELLQALVRIPSRYEQEHEAVSYVCRFAEQEGLRPVLVPMDGDTVATLPDAVAPFSRVPGRNNVVVRRQGAGGGRSLILNCHLDVQPEGDPAAWTHPPFAGAFSNGAVHGRGAMDDKAGVAICLGLLSVLTREQVPLAGDVLFQFVLEDEITANGSLAVLEAGHRADAAIIVDGTRPDRAIQQHAGALEFRVIQRGVAAPAGVSHLGVNAAELLMRLLQHLRDVVFGQNASRQAPWTEFPSPFQLVITDLQAESVRFSIPDAVQAGCFVTFPPPTSLDDMRRLLAAEAERFAGEDSFPHPPELLWSSFATDPVSGGSPELDAVLTSVAAAHGIPALKLGPSTGTSDLRHFARRGIPCLLYGPGRGFNPHRPDEHFLVADLPRMVALFLDFAAEWCGTRG